MMQQQLPELPNWLTAEIKLVYGGIISEEERVVYIPYRDNWDTIPAIKECLSYKYKVQSFIN